MNAPPPLRRPIWFQPLDLGAVQESQRETMVEALDIRVVEIGEDYLRGTMPVDARTVQPMRLLHGGASCVLAETLGSIAANCCVDPEKYSCVGQEISASHIRSAFEGSLVTGTARPWHLGQRAQVWHIELADERGRTTCVSRLTMAVLERPQRFRRMQG